MAGLLSLKSGFDVDYYLSQVGMRYYLTAAGEPPGVWAGKGAAALGLSGEVDPEQARALYHHDVAPDGTPLGTAQRKPKYEARASYQRIQENIDKRVGVLGKFALPEEIRQITLQERAKARTRVPFYDYTFSVTKSVSLLHAGLRAAASRARAEQREADAERLEARARSIENVVMTGAKRTIELAERRALIVRTGHHSATSGEFRDGAGLVASIFLQHDSRDGDPQLHAQSVILNRAQRADGEDEKWRALDGRPLYWERLGISAHAAVRAAQELARMGLPLVKRPDGNGWEIGGISQEVMNLFSSRTTAILARREELVLEYQEIYGRAPDQRALSKLSERATLETRQAKQHGGAGEQQTELEREAAAAGELAAWIARAEDGNVQTLDSLPEAVAAYVAEHPESRPEQMPSESERARVMRIAVAEVQAKNAAWRRSQLEHELAQAMPTLPASAEWEDYLDGMADDILAGGAEDMHVIRIAPVPDVVDVARLGVRSDGASIYRPPGEARYVTAEHLDTEEWCLRAAKSPVRQRVTEDEAREALGGAGLDPGQLAAAVGLLTSQRLVTPLVAPAGTGKSFLTAAVARAWTSLTGGRVIGLAVSENAARVLAGEGMNEAWNIARFFANHVPVHEGDILVIDEATQVDTTVFAKIESLAIQAGARVIPVGDTAQIGAVGAGGMFPLIVHDQGAHTLHEVRRFERAWERDASLKLREGDLAGVAEYDARGHVVSGNRERVHDLAVKTYLSDTLHGKESLLLAASNEEAAQLAKLARQRLIELRKVSAEGGEVTLRDGNRASLGDLVRARLNTKIDAGGKPLTNRDVIRLTGWHGAGAEREAYAQRQTGPGQWSDEFTIRARYLEKNAELAYAGNVHVAQGRTVDTGHLVVSEGMTRDLLYVGMTRGRQKNTMHVVTGAPRPDEMPLREYNAQIAANVDQAARLRAQGEPEAARQVQVVPADLEPDGSRPPWEAVVAGALANDDPALTAIGHMRAAQAFTTNARHLLELKEAFWRLDVVPQIDAMVAERVTPREYQRYRTDPERAAFLQELRAHELGGRAIPDVLDAITATPLTGARSIAAVLHGRLGKEPAAARGETAGPAERTPALAAEQIREVDQSAGARQAELGHQAAREAPSWAVQAWGAPPAEPGALRDDWQRRAGIVGYYRELAGVTDPGQALGPVPAGKAELREAFHASVRALELADDQAMLRAMGRGELEAREAVGQRVQAAATPDVSAEIRTVEDAYRHKQWQADIARGAGNTDLAAEKDAEAAEAGAELARLTVADARRREWLEANTDAIDRAREAQAELGRRGILDFEPREDGEVRHIDPEAADAARIAQAELAAEIRERNRTPEIDSAEPPQHIDPRLHAAERAAWDELVAGIREENATWRKPDTSPAPEHVTPEAAEQARYATAQRTSAREAMREALAREMPVTDDELSRYLDAAEHEAQHVDPGTYEAGKAAQSERVTEAVSRTLDGPEEPEPAHVDPEAYTRMRAAQTARVEAERQARHEAAASAMPVTDAEIDEYGHRWKAERAALAADLAEARAAMAEVRQAADDTAAKREADRQAEAEAWAADRSRELQADRQAEAEAETEPSWQPPAPDSPPEPPAAALDLQTEAEAEAELEI